MPLSDEDQNTLKKTLDDKRKDQAADAQLFRDQRKAQFDRVRSTGKRRRGSIRADSLDATKKAALPLGKEDKNG